MFFRLVGSTPAREPRPTRYEPQSLEGEIGKEVRYCFLYRSKRRLRRIFAFTNILNIHHRRPENSWVHPTKSFSGSRCEDQHEPLGPLDRVRGPGDSRLTSDFLQPTRAELSMLTDTVSTRLAGET